MSTYEFALQAINLIKSNYSIDQGLDPHIYCLDDVAYTSAFMGIGMMSHGPISDIRAFYNPKNASIYALDHDDDDTKASLAHELLHHYSGSWVVTNDEYEINNHGLRIYKYFNEGELANQSLYYNEFLDEAYTDFLVDELLPGLDTDFHARRKQELAKYYDAFISPDFRRLSNKMYFESDMSCFWKIFKEIDSKIDASFLKNVDWNVPFSRNSYLK